MKLPARNYSLSYSRTVEAVEVHCEICANDRAFSHRYILGPVFDVADIIELVEVHEAAFHE